MKKFLLVVLIGMVLAFDMYGIVNDIIDYYESKNIVEVDKGYTIVYVE